LSFVIIECLVSVPRS